MPEKRPIKRALRDKRAGKSASTQAGEFVREEMHEIRRGERGARSPEQAIAIGLSKARRDGVHLPAPRHGKAKARTRRGVASAHAHGRARRVRRPAASRARKQALRREPRSTASNKALSRHAVPAARRRGATARSNARKAARNKGARGRAIAARKAARRRARRAG